MGVTIVSHVAEVKKAAEEAIGRALEIIGGMAETFAKENLTASKAVDTGLLRNSVTHALGGKAPSVTSYSADSGGQSGGYSGTADADKNGVQSVYVGSNVFYAPYIELGTGIHAAEGNGRQTPWHYKDEKGNWHSTSGMAARPYLRPALENHLDEWKAVLDGELSGQTQGE